MHVRACLNAGLTLALVAAVALASAEAAPKKKGKNKSPNKNEPVDQAMIGQLRDMHKLLARANPRYAGHRANAMEAVRKAIDALENDKGKGLDGKLGKGDGKADESKVLSDTQVRAAGIALGGMVNQLKALPARPYRTRAAGHLSEAMRELDLALKVSARR